MAHQTHTPRPTRKEVERALSPLDFPLAKEEIVGCATDNGAAEPVLSQLRALPLATYESADEVLRSIDVADQAGR